MNQFETPDYLSTTMEEHIRKIQSKKDGLIFEAVAEKVLREGLLCAEVFNVQDEANRRFPRIMCEHKINAQHWYWNDGSKDGLHLVSFYTWPVEYGFSEPYNFKGTIGFNYSFEPPILPTVELTNP